MKKNIVHQKTRFLQDEKQKNIQGTLKVTGKHILYKVFIRSEINSLVVK